MLLEVKTLPSSGITGYRRKVRPHAMNMDMTDDWLSFDSFPCYNNDFKLVIKNVISNVIGTEVTAYAQ